MNNQPIHYAILRDGGNWDGITAVRLQPEGDGALTLARIPGTANGQPVILPPPFAVDPSGLAAGCCHHLYLADTAGNRVVRLNLEHDRAAILDSRSCRDDAPGVFKSPCGVAAIPGRLYVADRGNKRIQVFLLPTLELIDIWEEICTDPACLAVDSKDHVYILDYGKKILRFNSFGRPDAAYNSAMAAQPDIISPVCMATGPDDTLYIGDGTKNQVLCIDKDGTFLRSLSQEGISPRALAAYADRIYVADGKTGSIRVFDCPSKAYIGTLPGYCGPVAAMAAGQDGTLFIKPGACTDYYRLEADMAFAASGMLTAGPFDAGEQCQWERVCVTAEIPPGTEVQLSTCISNDPQATPAGDNWIVSPSLDMLLRPFPRSAVDMEPPAQYLWLRVELKSAGQLLSPRIIQVQAETFGKSYLDYLPAIYRRDDAPEGFLASWLALFRSQLQDLELTLEDMFRYFDPSATPAELLPWLAQWLAFDLPAGISTAEKRALLEKAVELYSRRGTVHGLRDFIQLYTGVRPLIFEVFRERHIWQLGHTPLLGCSTGLAPALPDGMIVPGFTPTDPQFAGLLGEYYHGLFFDTYEFSRIDPFVNFPSEGLSFDRISVAGGFSVRWSGQVQARYSESYTFSIASAGETVRLWIDGRLVIDSRREFEGTSGVTCKESIKVALNAGKWYSVRVEYSSLYDSLKVISLSWSSRSQIKEVIPLDRLYAVRDEWANLDPKSPDSAAGNTLVVGHTVVGESGPLAASGYGTPLFSDTAHLFTVLIPAALVPGKSQRRKLRSLIEAEKPVHTDYHLCFVEPRMRVGFQSRIGIDSIIAGCYLGNEKYEREFARVGKKAHIGQDTVLG